MKKFTALLLFLCCLFYGCETLFEKNSQVAPECYQARVIDSMECARLHLVQIINSDDFKDNTASNGNIRLTNIVEVEVPSGMVVDKKGFFYFNIDSTKDINRRNDYTCPAYRDFYENYQRETFKFAFISNLSTTKCSNSNEKN